MTSPMAAPQPGHAPAPPPRVGVPVYIDTSAALVARYLPCPMFVEFGPGMRMGLAPKWRHEFFLPPGYYRLHFYSSYFFIKVGKADVVVDTRSGMPVHLVYAAPYTIYHGGSAGPPPQQRQGKGMLIGILVVLIVLVFGGSGFSLLLALLGY